jgi:hypothetical protein
MAAPRRGNPAAPGRKHKDPAWKHTFPVPKTRRESKILQTSPKIAKSIPYPGKSRIFTNSRIYGELENSIKTCPFSSNLERRGSVPNCQCLLSGCQQQAATVDSTKIDGRDHTNFRPAWKGECRGRRAVPSCRKNAARPFSLTDERRWKAAPGTALSPCILYWTI